MSFTQTRFLGSSVINWSSSVGWGDSPSTLSVSLVDDPSAGDSFSPTAVGYPKTFNFGNFSFTGILQSYHRNISTSGDTYEASLTDGRDILEGTQLILDGYTGDVSSIYNVLNVYGYLESFGFGQSEKNETGIPWKNIRTAIHAITQQTQQGTYGGPIYYIQSRYIVDLSLLPSLPDDYRVGSESMSVLQYITEVCEAGGCDFYVSMTETTPGIFVIQVHTVSRTSSINYGAVAQFLAQYPQYEAKQIGFELQNEVMSKFLVGGPIRELWYQYADGTVNTIWPFWGYDINGNPIIGQGIGDDHMFVLDSRSVANPRVGAFYASNVAELRAVLAGRASWETFILFQRGTGSIHTNKAVQLNIIGYVNKDNPQTILSEFITNYQNNNGVITSDPGKTLFPHMKENTESYEQLDIEIGYLYDFLYHIATEYYGKKFMVSIPFTLSTEEPDTGKIRLSQLPVESGYLDETLWPVGISNNLLPIEVDRFTEEDGKIVSFVRFNNGDLLDLSDLNQDSVSYNSTTPTFGANKLRNVSVFVKCEVDENVVFLDKVLRYGPRAIITLDGVVRDRVIANDIPGKELLEKFLKDGFSAQGIAVDTPEFTRDVIQKFTGYIGQDIFNYGNETSAVTPDMAVVPLESQINFYGPWYAAGAAGKVDYEKDDSLVPWNYGGWTALNIAAESKVNQAIGTNFQLEQGEITFPDVPFHNLGHPLLFGGPLVTDISVNIGSDGAHTTYKFRRNVKQPKYGQARADRVAQLSRRAQQLRRNAKLKGGIKRKKSLETTKIPINIITRQDHPKVKKNSSHEMLVGQVFTTSSGNQNSSVFLQADYNFIGHVKDGYADKAYMSLDGLLTPFSTVQKSGWPSFVTLSGTPTTPTVEDLNTFKYGTNVKIVAGSYAVPNDLYGKARDGMRPLALRGPIYISGPAYSTDGYPLPNSSSSGNATTFSGDYLTNCESWPTGPVDLRFDQSRGVYVAGGVGGGLIRATATSFISPSNSITTGISGVQNATGTANLVNGTSVNVSSWVGQPVCSGDRVMLSKEDNNYYIVISQFKPVSVTTGITCSGGGFVTTSNVIYLPSSYVLNSGNWSCS